MGEFRGVFHRTCHQWQLVIHWLLPWQQCFIANQNQECHFTCQWMTNCYWWQVLWNGPQILICLQTLLLFTKPHFQTFFALKKHIFSGISDYFRLFLTDALTPLNILLLTFKAIHNLALGYVPSLIEECHLGPRFRSLGHILLSAQQCQHTPQRYGDFDFLTIARFS